MDNPNTSSSEQVPEKDFKIFEGLKLMREGIRDVVNVQRALEELNQGLQQKISLDELRRVTTYLGQMLQKLTVITKGISALPELRDEYSCLYGKMTGIGLDNVGHADLESDTMVQRQNIRLQIFGIFIHDDEPRGHGFDIEENPSINPGNNPLLTTIRDLLIVLRSHNFIKALPILSQQEISDLVTNLRRYLAEMEKKREN